MKEKYNREELKLQYFLSPIIEVGEFIGHQLGINRVPKNGNMLKKTKGWKEEKGKFKEKIIKQLEEETKEKMKEIYRPDLAKLIETHKELMEIIMLGVGRIKRSKHINFRDVSKIREIVLTEMGRPTKIIKQETIIEPKDKDPLKQRLQHLETPKKQCENSSPKQKSKQ